MSRAYYTEIDYDYMLFIATIMYLQKIKEEYLKKMDKILADISNLADMMNIQ